LAAGYEVTSCPDDVPNCLGYALGDMEHFWDPDGAALRLPPYRWMLDLPLNWRLGTVTAILSRHRYQQCGLDDSHEVGFEKIAIYVDDQEDGEVSHVTRQLTSGKWISKLGVDEDIEHDTAHALEGDTIQFPKAYGRVALIMRRGITAPTD
jgi:hypothetical protein